MPPRPSSPSRAALACLGALALPLAVAGCGGIANNRTLYSVHQPVVEETSTAIDLVPVSAGLPDAETRRLATWLGGLRLRYGDRVTIDDAAGSEPARRAIAALVAHEGLMASATAPGALGAAPGSVRVVVARARASVPGCPDWSAKSDFNFNNATSSNYGCATNGNLAAMIADPEHLLHGDEGADDAGAVRSRKAIELYRNAEPSGAKGLTQLPTSGSSSGSN